MSILMVLRHFFTEYSAIMEQARTGQRQPIEGPSKRPADVCLETDTLPCRISYPALRF